jgi:hypothetical protein
MKILVTDGRITSRSFLIFQDSMNQQLSYISTTIIEKALKKKVI